MYTLPLMNKKAVIILSFVIMLAVTLSQVIFVDTANAKKPATSPKNTPKPATSPKGKGHNSSQISYNGLGRILNIN